MTPAEWLPQVYDELRRLAGEHSKVITVCQEQLKILRKEKDEGEVTQNKADMLARIGRAYLALKKWTDAEPHLREELAIREKTEPESWQRSNTQSMLRGALLGQKKYADAEPLLLKGYEGMKLREKSIPPQGSTIIPKSIDRLIELYTATKKPDEVKKWKAERWKYPKEVAPPPRAVK